MDSLFKDVVRKLSLDRGPKFDLREGQKYGLIPCSGHGVWDNWEPMMRHPFPFVMAWRASNLQQNFTVLRAKIQVNDP